MALGPKAMGEAIAHNLKAKTGRTLEEWLVALDAADAPDRATALAWLGAQGLGRFQARLVVDRHEGGSVYDDDAVLVDRLFATRPEQRGLYDRIVEAAHERHGLAASPCTGYVPLYSPRRRIVASLTPTPEGLYLGLIGEDFPFPVVAHRRSLGGSARMTRGVLVRDEATALAAIALSCEHDEAVSPR